MIPAGPSCHRQNAPHPGRQAAGRHPPHSSSRFDDRTSAASLQSHIAGKRFTFLFPFFGRTRSRRGRHVIWESTDEAKKPPTKFPLPQLHIPSAAIRCVSASGHLLLCSAPRVLAAVGRKTPSVVHHLGHYLFNLVLLRLFTPGCFACDLAGPRRLAQCLDLDARRGAGPHSDALRRLLC